jgi:hypothetical protein
LDNDALAPVIAVMLILAIGVTVFAVYTSTYLPGLKQQDEVDHLQQVETGFTKFSSDIDNTIASGKPNITYSEQIPLGGGDIIVNSLKSSGTIRIQNEYPGTITINGVVASGPIDPIEIDLSLVNYSYIPDGNFWVDQGYVWDRGYVNVTKGTRKTPLQYTSDGELKDAGDKFAGGLVTVIPKDNDRSNATIQIIKFVAGRNNVTSSNGVARLVLSTRDVTDKENSLFKNSIQDTTIMFTPEAGMNTFFPSNMSDLVAPPNNITFKIIEIKVEVN